MPSEQGILPEPMHAHDNADEHVGSAEQSDGALADHAPCDGGSEHIEHGLVDGDGQEMSLGEDRYTVDKLKSALQRLLFKTL